LEWGILLVGVVLSAGLGSAGGQVALLNDRRKRPAVPEDVATVAAFRLEHLDGQTWSLLDVGDAAGSLVRLLPFVDRVDAGLQVLVSWTSEDNVRRGPVRLGVPPPR